MSQNNDFQQMWDKLASKEDRPRTLAELGNDPDLLRWANDMRRRQMEIKIQEDIERGETLLDQNMQCIGCHQLVRRRDGFHYLYPAIADTLPRRVLESGACEPCGWKRIEQFQRTCPSCGSIYYLLYTTRKDPTCPDCRPLDTAEEARRIAIHNKEAIRQGRAGNLTLGEWLTTLVDFEYRCAYCRSTGFESIDHFLPYMLDGDTSAANCVPCCASCNSSKMALHPDLWRGHEQQVARVRSYLAERNK